MVEAIRTRMSATEFFEMPETMLPTELIDGVMIEMNAPADGHQRALMRLIAALLPLLPPGEFRCAPADVCLDAFNVVQPDLFWVRAENPACRVEGGKWLGVPDFIVEILSPGTSRRDRKEKFALYEQHGVGEYWLVDPDGEYVEVYRLQQGVFMKVGIFGPEETFESVTLGGKTVSLSAVFAP